MAEFWEESFKVNREMWGFDPAKSTVLINDFFVEQSVKNVLIPGIGYGRNAQLFRENGMQVTGIEISKTAIDLAHKHFGEDLLIHHGSATEMPFDENLYDGIYCYALLQLLDQNEREKLIQDCYDQLAENGFMVFATVSKKAPMFGQGIPISKDRFEVFGSVKMYFYDRESIEKDFANAGLFEIEEVDDIYPLYLIKCKKTG